MKLDPSLLPLIDLLGKGSGLVLLVFALHSIWRRSSAAHRSLVWLAAFAALAILPATLLVKPWWSMILASPAATPLPAVSVSMTTAEDVPALPQPVLAGGASITFERGCGVVWAAGCLLVLSFRGLGGWQLRRLRRTSETVQDPRIMNHLSWLTEEFGITRPVETRQSTATGVPLTWGWLKPVLLLPAEAATWDDEALDAALRHELGHMRHHDACTRWLAMLVCALWWPLPWVWMAAKAWRLEQEKACDDLVLRAGAPAEAYAMQLLNAARTLSPGPSAAMAMARPSTLETRLRAVMDGQRNRRPMTRRAWMISGTAAMLLGSLCMLAQLRAAEPSATEAKARQLILPQVIFKNATLDEAVDFVRIQARELDPEKTGINIVMGEKNEDVRISLDLRNVQVGEALHYITDLANMKLSYRPDAALIQKQKVESGGTIVTRQEAPAPIAAPELPIQAKAKLIILPRVTFKNASLAECIEFFRTKSLELDPERGINIVLKPAIADARITLDLSQVPLSEALLYVTSLAGCKIEATPNALIISPQ